MEAVTILLPRCSLFRPIIQRTFFYATRPHIKRNLAVPSSFDDKTSNTTCNPPMHSPQQCLSTQPPISSSFMERFVSNCPANISPYLYLARLNRPIGTWLVYLPATWGLALATPPGHLCDLSLLALIGLGSLVIRSAGCTINDIWDQKIDAKVERTKSRPLASGALSTRQAFTFFVVQLSCGALLLTQFNLYTICLCFTFPLFFVAYPLFKKVTYWPQVMLGVTINLGSLAGYSAVAGFCDWSICLPLFFAAANWTIIYDSIYAYMDIKDDKLAGVKSTAIRFGDNGKLWLTGFAGAMASSLVVTGVNSGAGGIFYAGVLLTMTQVTHQIYSVDLKSTINCLSSFQSNRNAGIILFSSIVLDRFIMGI